MRGRVRAQVQGRAWEKIFAASRDVRFVDEDHHDDPGDLRTLDDLRAAAKIPGAKLYVTLDSQDRVGYTLQTDSGWWEFFSDVVVG